jgi:hypothetical protein
VKSTSGVIATLVVILTAVAPPLVRAQDRSLVPLKVDLVVSRTAGTKKITSLPYTLWATANDKHTTSVRMGVEIPVTTTILGKEGAEPQRTWTYRSVGTNIDLQATSVPDGRFSLQIRLTDSSVDREAPGSPTKDPGAGVPALRNFTSSFNILLRDGQTATYTSATDPVSGETLKVEVTLAVLK